MIAFLQFWLGLYAFQHIYRAVASRYGKIWFNSRLYRSLNKAWRKNKADYGATISIGLGYVCYETSVFNQAFIAFYRRQSSVKRKWITGWFSLGAVVVVLAHCVLPLIVFFVMLRQLGSIADALRYGGGGGAADSTTGNTGGGGGGASLATPMIPGVNMSVGTTLLFWAATVVTLAVHEAGHALAAAAYNLDISGAGVFFAALYPGAYVRLEDSIRYVSLRTQLKVYCAGIWHNAVCILALQAALTVYPLLLESTTHDAVSYGAVVSSVAHSGRGATAIATVTAAREGPVEQDVGAVPADNTLMQLPSLWMERLWGAPAAPLAADGGTDAAALPDSMSVSVFDGVLQPGDVISGINGHAINSREDLYHYLASLPANLERYSSTSGYGYGYHRSNRSKGKGKGRGRRRKSLMKAEEGEERTLLLPAPAEQGRKVTVEASSDLTASLLGSPFVMPLGRLKHVSLTRTNEQALLSCCKRLAVPVSQQPAGGESSSTATGGECFVEEVLERAHDTNTSAIGRLVEGTTVSAGSVSAPKRGMFLRSRPHHHHIQGSSEGGGSTAGGSAETVVSARRTRYRYYCMPAANVYSHRAIQWLDIGEEKTPSTSAISSVSKSGSNTPKSNADVRLNASSTLEWVTLRPVAAAPKHHVFMLDILRRKSVTPVSAVGDGAASGAEESTADQSHVDYDGAGRTNQNPSESSALDGDQGPRSAKNWLLDIHSRSIHRGQHQFSHHRQQQLHLQQQQQQKRHWHDPRGAHVLAVVETTPARFLKDVALVDFLPKKALHPSAAGFAEEAYMVSPASGKNTQLLHARSSSSSSNRLRGQERGEEAEEEQDTEAAALALEAEAESLEKAPTAGFLGHLYRGVVYEVLLVQWPELLYQIIWLSLQLHVSVALFNVLPLPYMDGSLISVCLCKVLLPGYWKAASQITLYCCTAMVVVTYAVMVLPSLLQALASS